MRTEKHGFEYDYQYRESMCLEFMRAMYKLDVIVFPFLYDIKKLASIHEHRR